MCRGKFQLYLSTLIFIRSIPSGWEVRCVQQDLPSPRLARHQAGQRQCSLLCQRTERWSRDHHHNHNHHNNDHHHHDSNNDALAHLHVWSRGSRSEGGWRLFSEGELCRLLLVFELFCTKDHTIQIHTYVHSPLTF